MGDENQPTYSEANGNAAAVLHYMESQLPEDWEFRNTLTPEEEDLHFINNQDILEIAEELEPLYVRLEAQQQRVRELQEQFGLTGNESPVMLSRQDAYNVTLIRAQQTIANQIQAEIDVVSPGIELRILQEFPRIRLEFDRLARDLEVGREGYVRALGYLDLYPTLPLDVREQNPYAVRRTGEQRQAEGIVANWERDRQKYELLKEGFAVQLSDEALERLVVWILQAVVTEIVTLGLAKYLRAGQALAAAARAINRSAAHLGARFLALSPGTKRLLERARSRLPRDNSPTPPRNGVTVTDDVARQADEIPCNTLSCILF